MSDSVETTPALAVVPDTPVVDMPSSAPAPETAPVIVNDDAIGGPAPIQHKEVLEKIADEIEAVERIMPPSSWPKERWVDFANLPRDIQQFVRDSEEERNRHHSEKAHETARLQREAEAEVA